MNNCKDYYDNAAYVALMCSAGRKHSHNPGCSSYEQPHCNKWWHGAAHGSKVMQSSVVRTYSWQRQHIPTLATRQAQPGCVSNLSASGPDCQADNAISGSSC